MKKYFTTSILLFIATLSYSQVDINTYNQGSNSGKYFKDFANNYSEFLGTWTTTVANKTFKFTFYKTTHKPMGIPADYYIDLIEGSFTITVDEDLPGEHEVHNSIKFYPQSNYTSSSVVFAIAYDNITMRGVITDNGGGTLTSIVDLPFTLKKINLGNPQSQAEWTIKTKIPGMTYSIPSSAILTKIN